MMKSNAAHNEPIEDVIAATDPAPTNAIPPKDIFDDISQLRLDQNFTESAGVKKLLTSVPVRKPSPQDFVRVHPDAGFRENIAVIELKDDREVYLVPPVVANDLPGRVQNGQPLHSD